jgi:hypothetical protein
MRLNRICKIVAAGMAAVIMMAAPGSIRAQGGATVLTATTQLRNSGGVKFADGFYVLATLVDTSGYSTGLAAKYQAYFITELPIKVGGKSLPAGVYGAGFVGDKFVLTDVGAHDVLTVAAGDDAAQKRPMPLQVTADPSGGFRLYVQRKYVSFIR